MEQELADTLEIHKHLDNFRAYVNSFEKWEAPSGETLMLTEIIVTKNTFPSSFGIPLHPISEIEKYRDLSRAMKNGVRSLSNEKRGQIFILDSAAKPPFFWDQSVEGERLFMPSSALGG
jgi:hypothetical protein